MKRIIASETPIVVDCLGNQLLGILHEPENTSDSGVLLVVGGLQTRVGSHRQFISLARFLVGKGIPVLRFDYRGMGDSQGDTINFDETEPDIRVMIDTFIKKTYIKKIILWGLCDAASAISLYAYQDDRVAGLVMLNPWIRTESGFSNTYIKKHYFKRIYEIEFWKKIVGQEYNYIKSLLEFFGHFSKSLLRYHKNKDNLPENMRKCLHMFGGKALIILSGEDIIAWEFKNQIAGSFGWKNLFRINDFTIREVSGANHTFSSKEWREKVEELTYEWIGNFNCEFNRCN